VLKTEGKGFNCRGPVSGVVELIICSTKGEARDVVGSNVESKG
jgi:hypothetical protein